MEKRKENDSLAKRYIGRPEVFADLFNYYLFDGKDIIDSNNLEDIPIDQLLVEPKMVKTERDIFKKLLAKKSDNITYLLLGIENQTTNMNAMVLRNLLYDVSSYVIQAEKIVNKHKSDKIESEKRIYPYKGFKKTDRLAPVITLVIYFNSDRWEGFKSLKEMIDIKDKIIDDYIFDYKLNIIEPCMMTNDDFKKLKTHVGLILEAIQKSNDEKSFKELLTNDNRFERIPIEAAKIINEFASIDLGIEQEEGEYNMCKAVEEWKKELRTEGKAEGIAEGEAKATENNIKTMNKNGFDIDTIARALGLDIKFVKKVLQG